MAKKKKWLDAIKRFFSHDPAEQKEKKGRSKKWKLGKPVSSDTGPSSSLLDGTGAKTTSKSHPLPLPLPLPPPTVAPNVEIQQNNGNHKKHSYSVALASAVAAEAAAVAAHAAAEVVRLTAASAAASKVPGRAKEETAAIRIQTAFRGYLARRALRALRGLVRLKKHVDGAAVKRQVTNSIRSARMAARARIEIHGRRVTMKEVEMALRKQQLKNDKEPEKIEEDWDGSHLSKEQAEESLLLRQEAAVRRERALAYSFTHQWKPAPKMLAPVFFADSPNARWGWSWLEHWKVVRVRENNGKEDKEGGHLPFPTQSIDPAAVMTPQRQGTLAPRTKRQSTPPSRASSVAGTVKLFGPKGAATSQTPDTEIRSIPSLMSERVRRAGVAVSSVRDDDSIVSTPVIPTYMQSTVSTRAKAKLRFVFVNSESPNQMTPVTARRRLSFPAAYTPSFTSPSSTRRDRRLSS